MNAMLRPVSCEKFEMLSVLYAAGVLEDSERAAVEAHTGACPACAAVLRREIRLGEILAGHAQVTAESDPSSLLLARCRAGLGKALENAPAPGQSGWRRIWRPQAWPRIFRVSPDFHPAWSVAALAVVAVIAGFAGWKGVGRAPVQPPAQPLMTVSAPPPVTDQDLETMGIESLRWEPRDNASPQVEVQMHTDRPVILQGSPDDGEIRRVLSYVVENGSRFDPGLRLDSLELLRSQASDPRVSNVMRRAARLDPNPAVRLRALESLRGQATDLNVRQTLLEALARDENSGVRIEAVNALLEALGALQTSAAWPDGDALEILQDRMRNDPNTYVRLRSAAAFARLASLRPDRSPASPEVGPQP
jgi:hypothetical protein